MAETRRARQPGWITGAEIEEALREFAMVNAWRRAAQKARATAGRRLYRRPLRFEGTAHRVVLSPPGTSQRTDKKRLPPPPPDRLTSPRSSAASSERRNAPAKPTRSPSTPHYRTPKTLKNRGREPLSGKP
jgi:hypothetical protein